MENKMTWILTSEGKRFDYADPQLESISIEDIALSLSKECRFAGKCEGFYSVAQHSYLASLLVPLPYRLEALLHDAAEAYVRDIPTPLKRMLTDYKSIEKRVDAMIRAKFGLPLIPSPEVKRADLIMLATERRDLLPPSDEEWVILRGVEPAKFTLKDQLWTWKEARKIFLARFTSLYTS
jgi:uncharacterized protein